MLRPLFLYYAECCYTEYYYAENEIFRLYCKNILTLVVIALEK